MSLPILTLAIKYEHDVVAARQRARQLAGLLGFDTQDQIRIATAVSEIARNAYAYAQGGKVEFELEGQTPPQVLLIRISDEGPGIADLKRILNGQYQSPTGMGLGLIGAQRLMDQCEIESAPERGSQVRLKKLLPRQAPLVTSARLAQIIAQLAVHRPQGPFDELQQQNQELMGTLAELRERQEDLVRVNRELEDTNRGVVALYAELDEKADHLRYADEMKSRFLSNMTHEFRTPLNSILALSNLLLERTDGELSDEQEKQVSFIRKSAEVLLEVVNDLLDLAKIEAGKVEVHPVEFEVANLFSALRGMLRPLLVGGAVNLVFAEPEGIPSLYTDEGKVSQILRNFLSNALKFTERGEIGVQAELAPKGESVIFSVADTGIGIAPEDQARIFEEFAQVENPLQRRVKGTGLGLPLCQRLATLLGGSVAVESELGVGSTFFATIPLHYQGLEGRRSAALEEWELDPRRLPVLLVEDQAETRLIYDKFLRGSAFQLIPAGSLREAREALLRMRPQVIVLDILLRGEDTWYWLSELKANEDTRTIPLLVLTTVEDQRKGLALGADAYCIKPIGREMLLAQLSELTRAAQAMNSSQLTLLIIDDEEAARYIVKKLLSDLPLSLVEAADGEEGLRRARELKPRLIFLDLTMPGLSGGEVLEQLKTDPQTRAIPVVIMTSRVLTEPDRQRLLAYAHTIVFKDNLSSATLRQVISELAPQH